jgi:hypothetical protein
MNQDFFAVGYASIAFYTFYVTLQDKKKYRKSFSTLNRGNIKSWTTI